MKVFNHYPFLGLSVTSDAGDGSSKTLAIIPAQQNRIVLFKNADPLVPVSVNVFLLPEMDSRKSPSSQWKNLDKMVLLMQIQIYPDVPELHLGQVTSRIINKRYISPEMNALANQGLKSILLHNQTNLPIHLDNNLIIPPKNSVYWSGRDRYGVPFGTIFRDRDGVYPAYLVDRQITDLYYGLATTVVQPIDGGQQPVFSEHPSWGSYPFLDGDV